MAEETKNTTNETQETGANSQEQTPTIEELMAQLAAERAEKEKYKTASDKASADASKYKKELRSKQTAEEQEAEAKAEADRLAKEQYEAMAKELDHMKAQNAYKNVSDEKAVEKLIEAVSEADHNSIAAILEAEKQKAVKDAQAEWMKSRPPINAGSGDEPTVSQKEFNRMSYQERVELKQKNPELYKKYSK